MDRDSPWSKMRNREESDCRHNVEKLEHCCGYHESVEVTNISLPAEAGDAHQVTKRSKYSNHQQQDSLNKEVEE